MGVIALGKFENKLSEAGAIGGSAKQELLGVHFFTNLPTKTDNRTPAKSPLILLKKVLPAPPPLLALKSFFPTSPQPTGLSGADWSLTKLLKHLPSYSKRYFPAPPPLLALKSFFPTSPTTNRPLEQTGVAALHAGKKPGTEQPPSGQSLPGGILAQNGHRVVKVCWEESWILNLINSLFKINF